MQQLKDVCLSFALFKLLRCRFARYTAADIKFFSVQNFVWQELLLIKEEEEEDHSAADDRLFKVIADELSFVHDYYYSSLPIFYSSSWFPALSIVISLLTIVPFYVIAALVMLAETRNIASYVRSNWTKVALICHYVVPSRNKWWQPIPPIMQKWIGFFVLRRSYKPWKERINLCSVLPIHPRKKTSHLLWYKEKSESVKVPGVVKSAIIGKLRRSSKLAGTAASPSQSHRCQVMFRPCSGEGRTTTDVLLVWHIATCILEVRRSSSSDDNRNRVVATHLSGYCAYLVAYCPELLPDDDGWSKNLYKAVNEDARRAIGGRVPMSSAPLDQKEYKKLVRLLSEDCRHQVVKNGAKLAEQLVPLVQLQTLLEVEERKAWEVLAGFWSEMILYLAPSDNLEGHAEAIAHGGELITLLWALLTHAGVVTRPGTKDDN
uniref:DUF4220 domain-containing protein n=1 Tax=Oryza nivara TaxID=4536 RepID=A0A0E0IXH1_ORYNI